MNYHHTFFGAKLVTVLLVLLTMHVNLVGETYDANLAPLETRGKNKVRVDMSKTMATYFKKLLNLSYKQGAQSSVQNLERVLRAMATKSRMIDGDTLHLAMDEASRALELYQEILMPDYYAAIKTEFEDFKKSLIPDLDAELAVMPELEDEQKSTAQLAGDISGRLKNNVVNRVGGKRAAEVAAAVTVVQQATDKMSPDSLVWRDKAGNFEANEITAQLFTGVFNGVFNGTVNGKTTKDSGNETRAGAIACADCLADNRLVRNVKPCELGLQFIKDLQPVGYQFKNEANVTKKTYGLLAQDIAAVVKKHHANDFGGFDYNQTADRYQMRYSDFIAPLIRAVQELAMQNQEMRKQILELQGRNG